MYYGQSRKLTATMLAQPCHCVMAWRHFCFLLPKTQLLPTRTGCWAQINGRCEQRSFLFTFPLSLTVLLPLPLSPGPPCGPFCPSTHKPWLVNTTWDMNVSETGSLLAELLVLVRISTKQQLPGYGANNFSEEGGGLSLPGGKASCCKSSLSLSQGSLCHLKELRA